MKGFLNSIVRVISDQEELPFSLYSSLQEQHIFNVPISKPLLIYVLQGTKELGREKKIICSEGEFIFLSNMPTIDMRNIPSAKEYAALLIEFDQKDFLCLKSLDQKHVSYIHGEVNTGLRYSIQQFVEWSEYAPIELWPHRRQELLKLIKHSGFLNVANLALRETLSEQVYAYVSANLNADLNMKSIAKNFAMSDSTLNRKLKLEGTTVSNIRNKAKLSKGLHLIQTTNHPIKFIAAECGYQSQSRFTERFKQLFGLTPRELKATRMAV